MLKKNFPFLSVVGGQLLIVGCFFVNVINNDANVDKYVSVIHNENLDKIATSVSVLFKKEIQPVVMVDDTLLQLPAVVVENKEEEQKEEEKDKTEETTPLYVIDEATIRGICKDYKEAFKEYKNIKIGY